MGREIRRVPKDWQHPKDERGHYKPLCDGYNDASAQWDEGKAKWEQGLVTDYNDGWEPRKDCKYRSQSNSYEECCGKRPNPNDYMPDFPESERTHLQMYETCTEGTPISPVMEKPEELAHWLADNRASACGDQTASYEQWLVMIRRGWAPTMVVESGRLMSGVEASFE